MFKFLFGRRGTVEVAPETMRVQFERALGEVNSVLAELDPKPSITFDPVQGTIAFELPEQFPDEALALPAPAPAQDVTSEDTPKDEADIKEPAKEEAAA